MTKTLESMAPSNVSLRPPVAGRRRAAAVGRTGRRPDAAVVASPATPAASAASADVCDVRHNSPEVVGAVRRTLVSDRAAEALAATFSVLGDPTRVRLLDALAVQELCVCELAALVDSSESAVSHQLRLLRSLRLVRSRREGRLVFYRLDDDHIRHLLDQGRRHIEEQEPPSVTAFAEPPTSVEPPTSAALPASAALPTSASVSASEQIAVGQIPRDLASTSRAVAGARES